MGKIVDFFVWIGLLKGEEGIFYIGGSDVLPPPLKGAEEENALVGLEAGNEDAKQRLIEHNLRLVVYIARRFENTGVNLEDLISIGTIGLIKAIGTYRRDRNIRLATYACRCIENELLMYFRSTKKSSQDISLSEPIDNDSDGNAISLLDVISSEDHRLEAVELSDQQQQLYGYLETELDDREREVLLLRYGLLDGNPMPQREVADHCGISRSYV